MIAAANGLGDLGWIIAGGLLLAAVLVWAVMSGAETLELAPPARSDAGLEDELERIRVGAGAGTTGPSWQEPGAGEPVAVGAPTYVAFHEDRVEIAKRIVAELSRRLEVHHREIGVDPARNGCHVCRPGGSLDLWERDR